MKKKNKDELLKWGNNCAWESQWASREWRAESWRDHEMYDGGQASWTQEDYQKAQDAGIDPITINRTFPTVNMMLGSQAINRYDIVAKGRTQDDGQVAEIVSEGIKFVFDQNEGDFVISEAFKNAVIPGFGCVAPSLNEDPRKETLAIKYRDWKEIWWDPFSPPWWTPQKTRYVYWQRWTDLEDFKAVFYERRQEIEDAYREFSGEFRERGYAPLMDEAQAVEEHIRTLASSDWIDTRRKRIRPVEMWYPVNELCIFALFPDGRCLEIKDGTDPVEAYQIINSSQQVLKAIVKKMRVMTFFGEHLLLQDGPSPFNHDQYPLVPFIGYIDRYGQPYGVPRQIRGQNEEVNKRRSMALALLRKRRVKAERGVVGEGDNAGLQHLYEEANKLDGFMVVDDGKIERFQIEELANLAQPQVELMRQSELEIREISGSNAESLGYDSNAESGIAKKLQIQRSQVTTATLYDNLRRSMTLLGYQTVANMQQYWKYEKVLRVTDKMTGAERFVTVNQPVAGGYEVKNNITQGRYDIVVSEAPATDTVREKNMELLYAAIEKSPPEATPTLLIAAFEMSDLPNKEMLIEKLKPILGVDPTDESEDPEETKQKVLETLAQQKEENELMKQLEMEGIKLELNEKRLKNLKTEAEIKKIEAEATAKEVETDLKIEGHELDLESHELDLDTKDMDALGKGLELADRIRGKKPERTEKAMH